MLTFFGIPNSISTTSLWCDWAKEIQGRPGISCKKPWAVDSLVIQFPLMIQLVSHIPWSPSPTLTWEAKAQLQSTAPSSLRTVQLSPAEVMGTLIALMGGTSQQNIRKVLQEMHGGFHVYFMCFFVDTC